MAAQLARNAIRVDIEDRNGAVESPGREEVALMAEAQAGRMAAAFFALTQGQRALAREAIEGTGVNLTDGDARRASRGSLATTQRGQRGIGSWCRVAAPGERWGFIELGPPRLSSDFAAHRRAEKVPGKFSTTK